MTRLDEIKARRAARTPGRWRFCIATGAHQAALMAEIPDLHPTRTVLDFVRWGPRDASMRLYDGRGNDPRRIDKLVVDGRVQHPDAAFIEHAPEDIDWLISEVERLSRQNEGRLRTILRLLGWSPSALVQSVRRRQ